MHLAKALRNELEGSIQGGRAIAEGVGHRCPTAAARVLSQVRSCRICGRQEGTGAGFPRTLGQFLFHQLIHIH
jgi:hypothetical protein